MTTTAPSPRHCASAAGLFGEDLAQRGYRRDRAVLAHIAVH
ncbi:hypothetical protein ACFW1M_11535 [Streptomyces inhibens]